MANGSIEKLTARSFRRLDTARSNLSIGDYESAINRAYYSAFASAHCTLLALNMTPPKTHGKLLKAVLANLKMPGRLGDAAMELKILLENRQLADYTDKDADQGQAEDCIRRAEEFNRAVAKFISRHRPTVGQGR